MKLYSFVGKDFLATLNMFIYSARVAAGPSRGGITYLARGGHHHLAAAAFEAGKGRDGGRGRAARLAHAARRAVPVGGILRVLRV